MPHNTDPATLALLLAAARKHGGTDEGAADWLAGLMEEVGRVVEALRHRASWTSPTGLTDRVQMAVYGPDGNLKQTVDTGGAS